MRPFVAFLVLTSCMDQEDFESDFSTEYCALLEECEALPTYGYRNSGDCEDHATVITEVDLTAQDEDKYLGDLMDESRKGVRVWQDPFKRSTGIEEVLREYEDQLEVDDVGSESE